ncbi:MAG TPA: NAD(+) diphosphatase [Rhodocyclaceae bacterium]|nr:NAD(+) diphosphatase [Rhodocyclaceae bacterium]
MGDDLLLHDDDVLADAADISGLPATQTDFIIGTLADIACRALWWPKDTPLAVGLHAISLRNAHGILPADLFHIAVRAKQLVTWDLQSRYCGACGTATQTLEGEPAKECPACKLRAYPRLSPAIMVLIRRDRELLLARPPHFRPGFYSALAGFVEAGESVEACVHREVQEEVSLRVTNLRWFGSQSWPFPHSLMLAFHADYLSGDIVPQASELEDARWFSLDELPELPSPVSIAYRLITAGIEEIRQGRRGV